ncbi:MAG: DUF255 domain-containing protein [Bacteroidales bacterium]|jgi:thioredoxin-related protein|nr:DUF255 domain-containing protein [Bacteroidales bacterium]
MKLKFGFLSLLLSFSLLLSGQEEIKWLSIEEAQEKAIADSSNAKMYFVDCYTDWCGWCKRMDKDTFTDTLIAKLVNHYFYPVKFNAEQSQDVTFNGKVYKNTNKRGGRGSAHQLAYYLLNNRLSYPSFSVLGSDGNLLTICPGYHKAPEFEIFLVFMGEEFYKETNFETFSKEYVKKYRDQVLSKLYSE